MLGAIVAAIALAVSPPAPTDEELAGSRVVTGFSGHRPPALRRMIREGRVSGVILFDRNAGTGHSAHWPAAWARARSTAPSSSSRVARVLALRGG